MVSGVYLSQEINFTNAIPKYTFHVFASGSFIRLITDHMIELKHIRSDKISLLDHLDLADFSRNLLP